MTQLYKKNGLVFIPAEITVEEVDELKKENTALKTQWHCAEIEKKRRMTNKELSRWLREKATREWKYKNVYYVYSFYSYTERNADEEVCDRVLIREDDGEWREPLVEA